MTQSVQHCIFGVHRLLSIPAKPWDKILIDFIVGMLECEMFDVIWIVVERLLKMKYFIPCHTMIDASGLNV